MKELRRYFFDILIQLAVLSTVLRDNSDQRQQDNRWITQHIRPPSLSLFPDIYRRSSSSSSSSSSDSDSPTAFDTYTRPFLLHSNDDDLFRLKATYAPQLPALNNRFWSALDTTNDTDLLIPTKTATFHHHHRHHLIVVAAPFYSTASNSNSNNNNNENLNDETGLLLNSIVLNANNNQLRKVKKVNLFNHFDR